VENIINEIKLILDKYHIEIQKDVITDFEYALYTKYLILSLNNEKMDLQISFEVGTSADFSSSIMLDFTKLSEIKNIEIMELFFLDEKSKVLVTGRDAKNMFRNKIKSKNIREYLWQEKEEYALKSECGFTC